MSCGEIRTVWQAEAAFQSLFHRNLVELLADQPGAEVAVVGIRV